MMIGTDSQQLERKKAITQELNMQKRNPYTTQKSHLFAVSRY